MHARKIKTRTHLKLELSKNDRPKESSPNKGYLLGGFIRCIENLVIIGWSTWIPTF